MSLIDYIKEHNTWIGFYDNRTDSGHFSRGEEYAFYRFIRDKRYIPYYNNIKNGIPLSNPVKKSIAKGDSNKKRIVYTYSQEENYLLKLITHLIIRKYDSIFSPNLYSFRSGHSVSGAIRKITGTKDIEKYYTYKADISNYFNSIDVVKLLPMLREALSDDAKLYGFLADMLKNPYSIENGKTICESKGAMAGTPTAVFFANLYLSELDKELDNSGIMYFRYSDDIIIFARSEEQIHRGRETILGHIKKLGLTINPNKEVYTHPGEQWSFLGFSYSGGKIDICPMSIYKIKAKMRRKARALLRWKRKKGKTNIMAARAFIKAFNKKFYETGNAHEMNWSRWYFPVITTESGLKEIDSYMQACIRYIIAEKHTKSNYNFRYAQMKELGYTSLVSNWYKGKQANNPKSNR